MKHLINNSLENTFKKNIFIENTLNKNTKHTFNNVKQFFKLQNIFNKFLLKPKF